MLNVILILTISAQDATTTYRVRCTWEKANAKSYTNAYN